MGRKSSGVAKGGLITGIIGTSLAGALAMGLGDNCGNGGLLGNLFGGRQCGPTAAEAMFLLIKRHSIPHILCRYFYLQCSRDDILQFCGVQKFEDVRLMSYV